MGKEELPGTGSSSLGGRSQVFSLKGMISPVKDKLILQKARVERKVEQSSRLLQQTLCRPTALSGPVFRALSPPWEVHSSQCSVDADFDQRDALHVLVPAFHTGRRVVGPGPFTHAALQGGQR